MPITAAQRERRRKGIGSSDSPALIGYDPYKTPFDVWVSKVYETEDSKPGPAAQLGNLLEDAVLDWCASERGFRIRKNQYRRADDGVCTASHDALVVDQPVGLEAKTCGLLGPSPELDAWDPESNRVPDRVLIQCHHQMHVSNLDLVVVPVLIGLRGLLIFEVERNDELVNVIADRAVDFWRNHVEAMNAPRNHIPRLEVLKRVRREPGKVVDIDAALIEALDEAKQAESDARKRKDEAQAAVLAALGDAEAGRFEGDKGPMLATYMEQTRRGYAVEDTTFRQLRIRKDKS